jgi:hypothetical protein
MKKPEFPKGPKELAKDEFAEKYNKPENKFYNFIDGKVTKPIKDSFSGNVYHIPVRLQLVILPDGTLKAREI